jgi:hypothetical protein
MNDNIKEDFENTKPKYSDADIKKVITFLMKDTNYEFMTDVLLEALKKYYLSKTEREYNNKNI